MRVSGFIFSIIIVHCVVLSPVLADTKPNIIFLFADDRRADTIGAHGNAYIQTPNLDQLAASGFSFRRNYCAGLVSGDVCGESCDTDGRTQMDGDSVKRSPVPLKRGSRFTAFVVLRCAGDLRSTESVVR